MHTRKHSEIETRDLFDMSRDTVVKFSSSAPCGSYFGISYRIVGSGIHGLQYVLGIALGLAGRDIEAEILHCFYFIIKMYNNGHWSWDDVHIQNTFRKGNHPLLCGRSACE